MQRILLRALTLQAGPRPRFPRRWLLLFLAPVFLVLGGTTGYHLIEGWEPFDALYMTVITLSTTGYGEIPHALSRPGRAFTMFLTLMGVFTMFYTATEIIRTVVTGEVAELLGAHRMERALAQIKDHIIVCGYGRMGKLVCREFARQRKPFVIVDASDAALADFDVPHGLALVGDATSDAVLKHAGIQRAHSLVTVMASDADNLFTTLSARLLNAKLHIVARVEDVASEQKLLRAGANHVVSPYTIGGTRVAQAVLKPTVVDFIELATGTAHIELAMEETLIAPHSPLAGCKLKESRLRSDLRVIIVAVKKYTGEMMFNPDPDAMLEAGDILVAIGHTGQLEALEKMANPPDAGKA